MLCKLLHCLPSQLDKEDAKEMEIFLTIYNDEIKKEEDEIALAKARGLM